MKNIKSINEMDHFICFSLLGIVMTLLWVGTRLAL